MQETKTPWVTVVGEVADVKEASPDVRSKEQYYEPVEQFEKSIGPFASPTDLNGNGGYIVVLIPLKRGRLLAEGDVAGRPLVAVINETAARLYWSGDDPIGRTIRYYPQETNPSIQIVGIVGNVRSIGASQPAPPAVYVPLAQAPRPPYEGRAK